MTKKMSEAEAQAKPADLDIAQDMLFERRQWAEQRVGWLIFALIVLSGLVGLLGSGPIARVGANGGSGTQVLYDRFLHRSAHTEFAVDPGESVSPEGTVEFAVANEILNYLQVHSIVPEPDSETLSGDEIIYSFRVGKDGPTEIVFHVELLNAGSFGGQIRINDGEPISMNHLVYP